MPKQAKHFLYTYWQSIYYCSPITLAKIKAITRSGILRKAAFDYCYNKAPTSWIIRHEEVASSHIYVGWSHKDNEKVVTTFELVPLARLQERFAEILDGKPFEPYEVPEIFKIDLTKVKLRFKL